MKGNQGLEALAALCNNASRSNEDMDRTQSDNSLQQQNLHNVSNHSSSHAPCTVSGLGYSSNNDLQGNTREKFNFLTPNIANILKAMGPNVNQQQFANVLAGTGILATGNNDASNVLQQINYMNYLQANPSMLNLIGQSNQGLSGSYPFGSMDANSMSALLLASQRQNGKLSHLA